MKRIYIVILMLAGIIILSGCAPSAQAGPSDFYASFSIGEVIALNSEYLGTGAARVQSGSETGSPGSLLQRNEMIAVPISTANVTPFLEAVKASIEEEIGASGAVVDGGESSNGSDSNPDYFSFQYHQGDIEGIINVWGVPRGDEALRIIVLITEE